MQRMNSRFEPWQQDAGAHMLSAILYRLKYCLILEKLHCSIWRLGEGPRTLCQAAMEPLKDSQYPGSWFNIRGPEAAVVWKAVKWSIISVGLDLVCETPWASLSCLLQWCPWSRERGCGPGWERHPGAVTGVVLCTSPPTGEGGEQCDVISKSLCSLCDRVHFLFF